MQLWYQLFLYKHLPFHKETPIPDVGRHTFLSDYFPTLGLGEIKNQVHNLQGQRSEWPGVSDKIQTLPSLILGPIS